MAKQRVALIGLGLAVAPHAKSLVDLSHRVEVAYAMSPSAARREAFARHFPFPTTGELDTVLNDGSVDAVFVLTPPSVHLDIVRRAARAGKHVLLEKPIETTTERALQAIDACAKASVILGNVLQHRFRPVARRLKQIVAEGGIGRIAHASVAVPWWRPQSYYDQTGRGSRARDGGGVLITQAIHTLDLFLHLVGPVESVSAFAGTSALHRMETEDQVAAALRFASGALGALDCTVTAFPGFPERILIVGDKGTINLAGSEATVDYHPFGGGAARHETVGAGAGTGGGANPMDFPHDWHRDLIADFLDAVAAKREPAVPGREAIRVMHLIDALLRSAAERRIVAPAG